MFAFERHKRRSKIVRTFATVLRQRYNILFFASLWRCHNILQANVPVQHWHHKAHTTQGVFFWHRLLGRDEQGHQSYCPNGNTYSRYVILYRFLFICSLDGLIFWRRHYLLELWRKSSLHFYCHQLSVELRCVHIMIHLLSIKYCYYILFFGCAQLNCLILASGQVYTVHLTNPTFKSQIPWIPINLTRFVFLLALTSVSSILKVLPGMLERSKLSLPE